MRTVDATTVQRILRKYTGATNVDSSLRILRKLGKESTSMSQRHAAELVYLACATVDTTRTRRALAMCRSNTPESAMVEALQRQLAGDNSTTVGTIRADLIKELAQEYNRRSQTSNASTPGYVDGQRIQVRGGANRSWTPHAAAYVIDNDTPKTEA